MSDTPIRNDDELIEAFSKRLQGERDGDALEISLEDLGSITAGGGAIGFFQMAGEGGRTGHSSQDEKWLRKTVIDALDDTDQLSSVPGVRVLHQNLKANW